MGEFTRSPEERYGMTRALAGAGLFVAAFALGAAACAGPRAGGPTLLPGSSVQHGAASPFAATTTTLHILVPKSSFKPKAKTLTVVIDGKSSTARSITLEAGKNALALPLEAGTHLLTITTAASGKRLSTNKLFVKIGDCVANDFYLALYEAPAEITVFPENLDIAGSVKTGFTSHFGEGLFDIVALDVKDRILVGPGSPSYTVSSSNAKISAAISAPDTLALATSVPFDQVTKAKIAVKTAGAKRRFDFATEFTTWPTPSPTPSPARC